jgi:hypothetical protein
MNNDLILKGAVYICVESLSAFLGTVLVNDQGAENGTIVPEILPVTTEENLAVPNAEVVANNPVINTLVPTPFPEANNHLSPAPTATAKRKNKGRKNVPNKRAVTDMPLKGVGIKVIM